MAIVFAYSIEKHHLTFVQSTETNILVEDSIQQIHRFQKSCLSKPKYINDSKSITTIFASTKDFDWTFSHRLQAILSNRDVIYHHCVLRI